MTETRSGERSPNLLASFQFAAQGCWETLRTQRNMRIHLLVAGVVLLAGGVFGVSRLEWGLLVVVIGLVLVAELFNTAIEIAIDLSCPEWNPLAKRAKDAAAGAVLVAALVAVGVGGLVFLPHLQQVLTLQRVDSGCLERKLIVKTRTQFAASGRTEPRQMVPLEGSPHESQASA